MCESQLKTKTKCWHKYNPTRMHSSRMRTVRCSGRLSCHARPPPATHAPLRHTRPSVPHTPPLPRTPLLRHACLPLCHACPLLCTEFLTHTCENITFPQLLLRTVKTWCSVFHYWLFVIKIFLILNKIPESSFVNIWIHRFLVEVSYYKFLSCSYCGTDLPCI